MVVAAGGFEKVSQERGWKKVTIPFNFPSTCTNSAYVMKTVYAKYLEAFEMEHLWGKPVPYGGLPSSIPVGQKDWKRDIGEGSGKERDRGRGETIGIGVVFGDDVRGNIKGLRDGGNVSGAGSGGGEYSNVILFEDWCWV